MNERQVVREAATQNGIRPSTLWGVYGTETSFGKDLATSGAGAEGPFQLMPGTARELGVKDPHNFVEAAHGAAKYLAQFKSRGLAGMLSAYNAGPAGGIQSDYVKKVEANARAWGTETSSPAAGQQGRPPAPGGALVAATTTSGPSQGSQEALADVLAAVKQLSGPSIVAAGASPGRPAFAASPPLPEGARPIAPLTPAKAPGSDLKQLVERAITAAGSPNVESTVKQEGGVSSSTPGYAPAGSQQHAGGPLGGLLPQGAILKLGRLDEGQDGQTNPGGAIIANGNGKVVAVKSDPGGFGPSYPLVEFSSGPLAGLGPIYFGHTLAAVRVGQTVRAGDTISHTGRSGVGNATVPGWFEIGLGNTLGQGNKGQGAKIAPHLR